MCYMTLIFNILLYVSVNDQLPKLVDPLNEKNYASFDFLCNMHILYSYSFAILLAFAFLRLLKYLNIVHAMYQLQSMISRVSSCVVYTLEYKTSCIRDNEIVLKFFFSFILNLTSFTHALTVLFQAMRDILSFSILFFYLYFVFAMVGLFLFGSKVS